MLKRYLSILTIFSMILMLTACSDSDDDSPKPTVLQITSEVNTLPVGLTTPLNADLFYDDGSTINHVTAVWESMNPEIATVDPITGVVTGISKGQAIIQATYIGLVEEVTATITDATLTSLTLRPGSFNIPLGQSGQFEVEGGYSDGSIHDLTGNSDINWNSSVEGIISFDDKGVITALSEGVTAVTASLGNVKSSGSNTINATRAVLINFSISPDIISKPKGLTQQFTATGYYSDNTEKDITNQISWKSETPNIVTSLGNGVFKGIVIDEGQISATFNDMISSDNKPVFTVTRALLTSFEIEAPNSQPLGKSIQFKAIAGFSSDEKYDVSANDQVFWQSSDPAIATVTSSGVVRGISEGQVTISALTTFAGARNSKTITIKPKEIESIVIKAGSKSQIITPGYSKDMKVVGVYTDGSIEQDIEKNEELTWDIQFRLGGSFFDSILITDSEDMPNLTINADDQLNFYNFGDKSRSVSAIIEASYNGLTDPFVMQLSNREILNIPFNSQELEFSGPISIYQAEWLGFDQLTDSSSDTRHVSQMNYYQASDYCNLVNYNGHQDWRLPSLEQLKQLYKIDPDNWNISGEPYWTSTLEGEQPYVLSLSSDSNGNLRDPDSNNTLTACVRER
ncbi:Ig-like domain-containing protein [Bacterioplanoides sp. SCSIO 12839]|uniref:Ig-like domain-containing protein n=1 Tax=Bacterioplanoides sp. SCSIO 12839 TaxID=2829569 RepID=UPI002104A218|nr:Ig-like domain-containing protein [Bacterioplanoides sp. SCSIO 12839]UTW48161.1 Ig-like domain-containing protein [Bacterioplanoides sp. SCSIO 12839]